MPNKGFRNYLEKRSKVVIMDVDEYKSTKMCSVCESETSGSIKVGKEIEMNDGSKEVKKVQVYGLRRCMNNECRITWDRELNADRNIMKIFLSSLQGIERPEYLCREEKERKNKELQGKRKVQPGKTYDDPVKEKGEVVSNTSVSQTKKVVFLRKRNLSQSK